VCAVPGGRRADVGGVGGQPNQGLCVCVMNIRVCSCVGRRVCVSTFVVLVLALHCNTVAAGALTVFPRF